MKYYILINQLVLAKENLDIVDGAILDYIYFYCNCQNEKVKKQRITDEKGEIWTWVDYQTLLKDMPMLRISSKQVISNRVKNIEKAGYIKTKRLKHQKKYFKMTAKSDGLFVQMDRAIHTDGQSYPHRWTNKDKTIKIKDNNTTKVVLDKKPNPLITKFLSYLKAKVGIIDTTTTWQRKDTWSLIQRMKSLARKKNNSEPTEQQIWNGLKFLVDTAYADKFHSQRTGNIRYLYNNIGAIVKSKQTKQRKVVIATP